MIRKEEEEEKEEKPTEIQAKTGKKKLTKKGESGSEGEEDEEEKPKVKDLEKPKKKVTKTEEIAAPQIIQGGVGPGLIDIDDLLGMGDSQPQAQSQTISN